MLLPDPFILAEASFKAMVLHEQPLVSCCAWYQRTYSTCDQKPDLLWRDLAHPACMQLKQVNTARWAIFVGTKFTGILSLPLDRIFDIMSRRNQLNSLLRMLCNCPHALFS